MRIRSIRAGFAFAWLATCLTVVGCGSSTPTSTAPTTGTIPAAAHYPGDPATKGVENTPLPKPK